MSKRIGQYPGVTRGAHSESTVTRSASISTVFKSPAASNGLEARTKIHRAMNAASIPHLRNLQIIFELPESEAGRAPLRE